MRNFDWLLFLSMLVVGILGLTTIWSVSPVLFLPQFFYLLLGTILFFLFSRIDYRIFKNLAVPLYLVGLLFLLTTFLFGQITRGSVRWIQVGGFTLQPSEIVKPILILAFATLYETSEGKSFFKRLGLGLLFLALPAFLVFKQPDLGSTLVIGASWFGILMATNFSFFKKLGVTLSFLLSLPVVWFFLKDYQKERLMTFLDPAKDPLGRGYHVLQSVMAVGSGQILGRGLGRGTQSQLAFLPERQTDFIFASLTEEMGFLGALILLGALALLLFRLLKIGQKSSDEYGFLLAIGVFSMLLFQVFVNAGMNLGIVPITGITLPLVSYGGSSLVATMICLGMVESVSRFPKKEETLEIK